VSKRVDIKISDIPVSLILEDAFSDEVASAYRHFTSEKTPYYKLRVNIVDSLPYGSPTEPAVFIRDRRTLMVLADEFSGYMDLEDGRGEVNLLPRWATSSLASFIKNICTVFIISGGGIMLHAAAIARNGKAYIFFGPSGSGKTTIAGISGRYTVLTDELVAIKRVRGEFLAYGIPSLKDGMEGSNEPFGIAGLFRLAKDKEVFLESLTPGESAAELMTVPSLYRNFSSMRSILNVCGELTGRVPCYRLHFRKDDTFWRCIDEHIKEVA
jgi:hypothetical protein